ncbi:hypothetical protein CEXT_716211 [Caerostris extrusa]|uniref:Uncharacterized protein n=1 Tax=Caerostris extrusa TaxID=172846 RepID=A0AAV4QR89_CAEEX|nr:hypothetical protein CEXT_716211 [Caerostris extrusa]
MTQPRSWLSAAMLVFATSSSAILLFGLLLFASFKADTLRGTTQQQLALCRLTARHKAPTLARPVLQAGINAAARPCRFQAIEESDFIPSIMKIKKSVPIEIIYNTHGKFLSGGKGRFPTRACKILSLQGQMLRLTMVPAWLWLAHAPEAQDTPGRFSRRQSDLRATNVKLRKKRENIDRPGCYMKQLERKEFSPPLLLSTF